MSQTEYLPIEIKFATDPSGTIEGLAAVFGGPADRAGDVVKPGAFAGSLAQHRALGTAPAMLWMHDNEQPIGAWQSLTETPQGLAVRGRLALGAGRADEAYALVKADAVKGLSIGFFTRKASVLPGGRRLLEEVDLVEISLVATPAVPAARITGIKSTAELTARQIERLLIDSGVPARFAKALIAGGYRAAARPDAADAEAIADLTAEIRARTIAMKPPAAAPAPRHNYRSR